MIEWDYESIYTPEYRGVRFLDAEGQAEVSIFKDINWEQFGAFLVRMAEVALRWFLAMEGNGNDERLLALRRKQLSIVLDPDRPETAVDQVDDVLQS